MAKAHARQVSGTTTMVEWASRKRRRSVAELPDKQQRKSLRAAPAQEGSAEAVVISENCESELVLPEQRPHADEHLLGTDANVTLDQLKKALTFQGVYVVPEAVRNALDALKRAACFALPRGVPVLRAQGCYEQQCAQEAVDQAMRSEDTCSKIVPESHESELFALLAESDAVAQVIGWECVHVKEARTYVRHSEKITAEIVHSHDTPEVCTARGIAVHPGNNANLAGGTHSTLKQLGSLVRYLSRKGFDLPSLINICKREPTRRSFSQKNLFRAAKDTLRQEPYSNLVTTGSTEHFDDYFGRRLRQSEALFFLERAAEHAVGSCHTVSSSGLESIVAECQRLGVHGCSTALLSSRDLLALSSTGTGECVPFDHLPGKALELARSSLHAVTTLLGTQVPLERIPRIARHAVAAAVSNGERSVPLDVVLEHDQDLLQALRKAAEQFRGSNDSCTDTDVWRMAQALAPLRNEAGTIESVVQAGALQAEQTHVCDIIGSACRFWQCVAQMLQWAQRNAQAVCTLAQQLYPHDANVKELPLDDATHAPKHAAFWRAVGTVVSDDSVKAINAAAEIVGSSGNAVESTSTLLTEECTSFVAQLAQLGTSRELDTGKAAAVLDAAGMWSPKNGSTSSMRSCAHSTHHMPSSAMSEKQQDAIRSAGLLDRLRMRRFALDKLESMQEFAKQWHQRFVRESENAPELSEDALSGNAAGAYPELLHLAEQISNRLRSVQAYVDKNAPSDERIRSIVDDGSGSGAMVSVFALPFAAQTQLEDNMMATQRTARSEGNGASEQQQQQQEQHSSTELSEAAGELDRGTITRSHKQVALKLLDDVVALQDGRSNGSFLDALLDTKEKAEEYKQRFHRRHASGDAAQPNEATTQLSNLLEALALKRSGQVFSSRAAAAGLSSYPSSLCALVQTLQHPVVQLDTSALDDSVRVTGNGIECFNSKEQLGDTDSVIIQHQDGMFESVERANSAATAPPDAFRWSNHQYSNGSAPAMQTRSAKRLAELADCAAEHTCREEQESHPGGGLHTPEQQKDREESSEDAPTQSVERERGAGFTTDTELVDAMQSKGVHQLSNVIQDALGQEHSSTLAQKLVQQVPSSGNVQTESNAAAQLVHACQERDTDQMFAALRHLLGQENISWVADKLAHEYDFSDSENDHAHEHDNNNKHGHHPATPVGDQLRRYGLSLATATSYKSEEAVVKALQDYCGTGSSNMYINYNRLSACLFFTDETQLEEHCDEAIVVHDETTGSFLPVLQQQCKESE